MNLRVLLPDERFLGFCPGIIVGLKKLEQAMSAGQTVYYGKKQPVQNQPFIAQLKQAGAAIAEWEPGCSPDAPYYVSPFGPLPGEVDGHSRVVDATCSNVRLTIKAATEHAHKGEFVVIVGEHCEWEAENLALWVKHEGGQAAIVQSAGEVAKLRFPPRVPIAIISQTSFRDDTTTNIYLALKMKKPRREIIYDSRGFCQVVHQRLIDAINMVLTNPIQVMIVVGDQAHSSQANYFASVLGFMSNRFHRGCALKRVFFANAPENIDPSMFELGESQANLVGIIGTTSAPREVIAAVKGKIEALDDQEHGRVLNPEPCYCCPLKDGATCRGKTRLCLMSHTSGAR